MASEGHEKGNIINGWIELYGRTGQVKGGGGGGGRSFNVPCGNPLGTIFYIMLLVCCASTGYAIVRQIPDK